MTKKYLNWPLLAIIALAFAVFLAGISRVPVPTVDGAVRASEARNILRTGQLWPIQYQGENVADHPPLFVWLTALSFKLFGITDVAANFIPRLFAFLTVIVTAAIAYETGLGAGVALLSAVILVTTRDFVLSSVRGYIEPMLVFFIYLAFWFTAHQKRRANLWSAATAGTALWLAAFSKGPVVLWPLLFLGFFLFWNAPTPKRRIAILSAFLGSFIICSAVWAYWVSQTGQWDSWRGYFVNQVLGSALKGRNGAQSFEPFFFIGILLKYYWPWLPVLLWATYRLIRCVLDLDFSSEVAYSWAFGFFGLGFLVGFSLVKWKFWYYIAPAYPAFALFIASLAARTSLLKTFQKRAFAQSILALSLLWIPIASFSSIPLHKERVPEIEDFRWRIHDLDKSYPMYFVANPDVDHNMLGTSGQWYFDKIVQKIDPSAESQWETQLEKSMTPAWVITGSANWNACSKDWCKKAQLIYANQRSALLLHRP